MVIGRSIQRFWLTAKRLGLTMQPVLATLAFAHYGERQIQFSKEPGLTRRAESLARSFSGDTRCLPRGRHFYRPHRRAVSKVADPPIGPPAAGRVDELIAWLLPHLTIDLVVRGTHVALLLIAVRLR